VCFLASGLALRAIVRPVIARATLFVGPGVSPVDSQYREPKQLADERRRILPISRWRSTPERSLHGGTDRRRGLARAMRVNLRATSPLHRPPRSGQSVAARTRRDPPYQARHPYRSTGVVPSISKRTTRIAL
jgi:hypothetical protein